MSIQNRPGTSQDAKPTFASTPVIQMEPGKPLTFDLPDAADYPGVEIVVRAYPDLGYLPHRIVSVRRPDGTYEWEVNPTQVARMTLMVDHWRPEPSAGHRP